MDGVAREVTTVAGVAPSANPDSGEETPAELNHTIVIRYRQDVDPAAEPRAILVAYPGFLAGAAGFEMLARALVLRAAAEGHVVEVWAIDRRANLLEDLRGMNTAEATGNPEIAAGYYFGSDTIDGAPFAGLRFADELSFMSEWGLAVHADDLRNVIAQVAPADRRDRVFLLGLSMGAQFAEVYAAWRFDDGTRAAEELAGVVLIDGVLRPDPISEDDYLTGGGDGGGMVPTPPLEDIRGADVIFDTPFIGNEFSPLVELLALRYLADGDAVVEDEVRDWALGIALFYSLDPFPAMTNAAALGWMFDYESTLFFNFAVTCGESTGGAVEAHYNGLTERDQLRPADPSATYGWLDAPDAPGANFTPLRNLAETLSHGATNALEWYFPMRFAHDLHAVGGAAVPEDGYQAALGLRAFDGPLMDAPVLAITTELVVPADYQAVADRIAPAVGAGRPNAGATRSEAAGFRVLDAPALSHSDTAMASDGPDNPLPAAIVEFVIANSPPLGNP